MGAISQWRHSVVISGNQNRSETIRSNRGRHSMAGFMGTRWHCVSTLCALQSTPWHSRALGGHSRALGGHSRALGGHSRALGGHSVCTPLALKSTQEHSPVGREVARVEAHDPERAGEAGREERRLECREDSLVPLVPPAVITGTHQWQSIAWSSRRAGATRPTCRPSRAP